MYCEKEMKNPLVSVIIPMYNEELYIARCISSLREQTYKPLEIIIIDDGSTDRSRHRAKKMGVMVLRQKHKGPGSARNTGARKAKGAILVFIDADMIFDKRYVEHLVAPIIDGRTIGTSHIDERVANPDNIWSQCWSINADLNPGQRTPEGITGGLNIFRAIKATKFREVGGFDTTKGYFDDTTIARKLNTQSTIVKKAIAYHYNPESLREVFTSARWIGRSPRFSGKPGIHLFRFCIVNSLRNGIRKIIKGAPVHYIIFKIVYDAGMFSGIFLSSQNSK